jgi:hypothetical protein
MKDETLISEGEFTFDTLTECDTLMFNPPLKVKWSCWLNEHTGRHVYINYDFGLTDRFDPYKSIGSGWHYNEIQMDTPLPEIVKAFVQYDLFHAFCHTSCDPNYSHLHWALFGNLKDRVKVIESLIDFS